MASGARETDFENAQRDAEAFGLPRYDAWCAALERRYSVMPLWYWNASKRRAAYAGQTRASIEWQQKQARINAGNQRFFGKIRDAGPT